MPKIQKVFILDVDPERFLNECTPEELMEVSLLVLSPRYQDKIKSHLKNVEDGVKPASKKTKELIANYL